MHFHVHWLVLPSVIIHPQPPIFQTKQTKKSNFGKMLRNIMTNQKVNVRILRYWKEALREDLDLLCSTNINIKMKK